MKSLTLKTKNRGNNVVTRRFRKYSFQPENLKNKMEQMKYVDGTHSTFLLHFNFVDWNFIREADDRIFVEEFKSRLVSPVEILQ